MLRRFTASAATRWLPGRGICLALALGSPAAAATLTDPIASWGMDLTTYVGGAQYNASQSGADVGLHTVSLPNATFLTEAGQTPAPFVQVGTSIDPSYRFDATYTTSATSRIQYDFRITANDQDDFDAMEASLAVNPTVNGYGNSSTIGVRLNGTAGYSATATDYSDGVFNYSDEYVGASVFILGEPFGFDPAFSIYDSCGAGAKSCASSFNFSAPIALLVDPEHQWSFHGTIALLAQVNVYRNGSASAFIDPSISLIGLDPDNWTIALSPGVGNAGGNLQFAPPPPDDPPAPLPEPATWGLMLLGFGAMGAAMRRRRTPGALVPAHATNTQG